MSRYGTSIIQYQPRDILLNNLQRRDFNNRYYSKIVSPGYNSIQENNTMIPNNLQFNHINRSISNISKEINTLGANLMSLLIDKMKETKEQKKENVKFRNIK